MVEQREELNKEIDTLRAQLSEAHAEITRLKWASQERDVLLQRAKQMIDEQVYIDDSLWFNLVHDIDCLGSSAEPSAPVKINELTDEQIIEAMRRDIYDADGGYVIDTATEYVVKAGRALLRVALERKL